MQFVCWPSPGLGHDYVDSDTIRPDVNAALVATFSSFFYFFIFIFIFIFIFFYFETITYLIICNVNTNPWAINKQYVLWIFTLFLLLVVVVVVVVVFVLFCLFFYLFIFLVMFNRQLIYLHVVKLCSFCGNNYIVSLKSYLEVYGWHPLNSVSLIIFLYLNVMRVHQFSCSKEVYCFHNEPHSAHMLLWIYIARDVFVECFWSLYLGLFDLKWTSKWIWKTLKQHWNVLSLPLWILNALNGST